MQDSPLAWTSFLSLHSFLILCHFGLAGEGESDYVGKKIPLTHRRQAFPKDHIGPQRGNMVGSAQFQAQAFSWETLEQHVVLSP